MTGARYSYSEVLKRGVVEEIESGRLSIRDAAAEVGAGVGKVQKWLDEYGRYKPKRDVVEVVMRSEKDKIAELEKALASAHLKIRVYDELINQANKKYKTDLKKNFGTPPHERSAEEEQEVSQSGRAAKSSARRATPTTSASTGVASGRGRRQS